MQQTECSETSVCKIQTPGNYPEESIQHSEHGESLKLSTDLFSSQVQNNAFCTNNALIWYDMYMCFMGLHTVSNTCFVVAFSSFTSLTGSESINLDNHHVSYLKEILL